MVFGNCDHQQLGVTSFGDNSIPWKAQYEVSLPQRLIRNGFPIYHLGETHRYKNEAALEVAQLANPGRDVIAAQGSFDHQHSKMFQEYFKNRYNIDSTVGLIHVNDIAVHTNSTKSAYTPIVLIAMVNDAIHEAKSLNFREGEEIALVTPYNAAVTVLDAMLDHARENATVQERVYLDRIFATTTDSMMGKQAASVKLDISVEGHVWEPTRSNVAFTRHQYALMAYGDTLANTRALPANKVSSNALITKFTRAVQDRVYTLNDRRFSRYIKFGEVFHLLGLGASESKDPTREDMYGERSFIPAGKYHIPQNIRIDGDYVDREETIKAHIARLGGVKACDDTTKVIPKEDDILDGLRRDDVAQGS